MIHSNHGDYLFSKLIALGSFILWKIFIAILLKIAPRNETLYLKLHFSVLFSQFIQ